MKYLEESELVDGEVYLCQNYDGHMLSCYFVKDSKEQPFELEIFRNTVFSWAEIRYVFASKEDVRKIYQ